MFNYLTLGFDCSPAAALRALNLREYALPFDWVQSNLESIEKCFQDKFLKYHTNLRFNHNKTRLIDEYGFQFPHDYPLMDMSSNENVGEGVFGEEAGKYITEKWADSYPVVKEKYNRRIQRFLDIVQDTKPIILLCRYDTRGTVYIKYLFHTYFNRSDIYIVNSSPEVIHINNTIVNCYTEKNGNWNEAKIWEEGINKIKAYHYSINKE